MSRYTLQGLMRLRCPGDTYYWVYRSRLPISEVMPEAKRMYARKFKFSKATPPAKPVVRVFKVGSKRLLVLRIGNHFVSSYAWDTLIRKVAFGPWKILDQVTLRKRWVGDL